MNGYGSTVNPRAVRIDGDEVRPRVSAARAETRQVAAKRVCMITHSFYEADNRVIRYAESLAKRGDVVEVLALRRNADMPKEEMISGVRVLRIQDRFGKSEKSGAFSFLWPLLRFLFVSSWWLTRQHRRQRYDM